MTFVALNSFHTHVAFEFNPDQKVFAHLKIYALLNLEICWNLTHITTNTSPGLYKYRSLIHNMIKSKKIYNISQTRLTF